MRTHKLFQKEDIIVDAYNNGRTLQELADFHHCSKGTIRNTLVRRGVSLRRRGRKRKIRTGATEVETPAVENPFRV